MPIIFPFFFQTPVLPLDALNELSITIPSSLQEHSEDEAMTSCLVTRLSITYEALMHDQLRHQWTAEQSKRHWLHLKPADTDFTMEQ